MSNSKPISPYKFLDAYNLEDAPYFFGREKEVEEAYQKVFQSKILLVYGASGTGKSSLVHCGLASQFSSADWMPINVRRGGNIMRSMNYQLEKHLSAPSREAIEDIGPEVIKAQVQGVFLDHFKPIYFIFDQFEELFIFGSKQEWRIFSETLQGLLASELDLHFIFVVRGDYLEYLNEFEKEIPGFFDNRLRIEKMSSRQAEQSIKGPALASGISLEDGFAESLLQRLSGSNYTIEPTFLQVYLDKLFRKERQGDSFQKSDLDEIGPISDILGEFVDEQVFKMPDPKLAWSILKCFVSLDGTKVPLRKTEIAKALRQLGVTCTESELSLYLEELVGKRILKNADEEGRMELRHDSLALKIYERISLQEKERLEVQRFLNLSFKEYQKRGTLLKDEDLSYIAVHERKLDFSAEMAAFIAQSQKNSRTSRRKSRNQRIIGLLILLLAISSLVGWYYTGIEKERANAAATLAQLESEEALRQKEIADLERGKAQVQEEEALKQALIAREAQNLAEKEKNKALKAERIARSQKIAADQARSLAQSNAEEALKQKALAEDARGEENRLRLLGLARQLALKSQQMEFPARAQLALQAYKLQQSQEGSLWESSIYEALLNAENGKSLDPFLETVLDIPMNEMAWLGNELFFISENQEAYSWVYHQLQIQNLAIPIAKVSKLGDSENGWLARIDSAKRLTLQSGNQRPRVVLEKAQNVSCLALSEDGNWLAWGDQDGSLSLYHIPTKETRQLSAHYSAVSDLSFDAENQRFASAGYDRMVQVWNLEELNQSPYRINNIAYWVAHIAFDNQQNLWVNSFEGHLYKFPLSSEALLQRLCAKNIPLPDSQDWNQWLEGKLELNNPCQP